MPKKLKLQPHYDLETLEKRYRSCQDPVEKTRWQLIWLFAQGRSIKELSEIMGLSGNWVRELIHRYNREGAKGLQDRRRHNKGAKPLLDKSQRERLFQALKGEPPGGGFWSGPKVAAWMSKELGREVKPQLGWLYLKRLGFSVRRPRRRHVEADEAEQESF